MKRVFLAFSFFSLALTANAQMTLQGNNSGSLTFRKSADFTEKGIAGSKYFNENFEQAKVNKGTQDFLIRYNAYSDILEYKNNKDVVELVKDENTHVVFSNGTSIELLNYNLNGKDISQYHQILLVTNNSKISKFRSIKLNPAKVASNSYETGSSASYKENKDAYFVTYKNQTIEFDGKAKDLEKLIPGKAFEIKKYFKDNKVKENDADMIKLGQFLSTL